jgi:hypothetical protein
MDKLELIVAIALASLGFVGSFYIKKLSPSIQLAIAIIATGSILLMTILNKENKYSFILILGLAWIIKCIRQINTLKHLK